MKTNKKLSPYDWFRNLSYTEQYTEVCKEINKFGGSVYLFWSDIIIHNKRDVTGLIVFREPNIRQFDLMHGKTVPPQKMDIVQENLTRYDTLMRCKAVIAFQFKPDSVAETVHSMREAVATLKKASQQDQLIYMNLADLSLRLNRMISGYAYD